MVSLRKWRARGDSDKSIEVLHRVAPRIWNSANSTVESILDHDLALHPPFHVANRIHAPTAFSRVEYRFSTDSTIRREANTQMPGMTALTALGNYGPREGELILWGRKDRHQLP